VHEINNDITDIAIAFITALCKQMQNMIAEIVFGYFKCF
jgi:hypothetical protein